MLTYRLLFCTLLLAFFLPLKATHYRAGEITYQIVNGKTYQFTFVTYTDPRKPANDNTRVLRVNWGDGASEDIPRTKAVVINSTVQQNTYVYQHSYSTDGVYLVNFADPNRVENIRNINGGVSVEIPFYVEAVLRINNSIGSNESPIMYVPPIDEGCIGFTYVHNPGAYDADGDSIAYQLIPPFQAENTPVPNYVDPMFSDSFSLNPTTGQVTWQKPQIPGIYNIAIRINEYRNNRLVGYIVRDMQIEIKNCPNAPPIIAPLPDFCVKAGETVNFNTSASDPNAGQILTLRGYAGPFEQAISKATLTPDPAQATTFVNGDFRWKTVANHVRYFSHQGIIKVNDNFIPELADIKPFRITVIGRPPNNLKATQEGNGLRVSWDKDSSGLANEYLLYRRIDSSGWTPGQCERGIPASTGFKLISKFNDINTTSYLDNNDGKGLSPMVSYCYRLVAVFPARDRFGTPIVSYKSESFASIEICEAIVRSKPVITQVSILQTSISNGKVKVSWLRPDTLNQVQFPPPYRFILKRANTPEQNANPIATFDYPTFASITDTNYTDTLLNTATLQPIYVIDFISTATGIEFIDASQPASSLRASVYSTDQTNILSWKANVPWDNVGYVVYRKNTNNQFDSIAFTTSNNFSDVKLVNNTEYCYLIKSFGKYSLLPDSSENYSQEICGTPLDTVRPCPPSVRVITPCVDFSSFTNRVEWINNNFCADDVVSFNIYFKKYKNDTVYTKLKSVSNLTFAYDDSREELKKGIGGCYVVTGVDSFNNESNFLNEFCVDNCPEYKLPNVFSPNQDGVNDEFKPFPYRFIDGIEIKIFNRWGQQVFTTEDPEIRWNGKAQKTGSDCADGIYFYTLKVYEQYLEGIKLRQESGSIQLIRN